MSFPRVISHPVNTLRPILSVNVLVEKTDAPKNGTGILSAKFFMALRDNLATIKVNAGVMVIAQANPLILTYSWIAADVDTVNWYASWCIGYYGGGDTIPELFDGPEIEIYAHGKKLVR